MDSKQDRSRAWESEFEHAGLRCRVQNSPGYSRCGYVEVGENHPWFGKRHRDHVPVSKELLERDVAFYSVPIVSVFAWDPDTDPTIDLLIDVHGGISFSGERGDGGHWFGFDTSHIQDDGITRSLEYVEGECRRLAEQLAKVPSWYTPEAR